MKIKKGAKIAGIRPEIVLAAMIADKIYSKYVDDSVLTEGTGGKHGRASLHYVGQAIDLRTSFFELDAAKLVVVELKESLGDDFDVVLETDHIHIEFQPK